MRLDRHRVPLCFSLLAGLFNEYLQNDLALVLDRDPASHLLNNKQLNT